MNTTNFNYSQKYSAKQVFEILKANKTKKNSEFLKKMDENPELKDVVTYVCHVIVSFKEMECRNCFSPIEDMNKVLNCQVEGDVNDFEVNVVKSTRTYEDYGDPRNYPVLVLSETISIDSRHIEEFYLGEPNKHIYQEYSRLTDVRHYIAYTDYLSLSERVAKMEAELTALKSTKAEIERIYIENNIDTSIDKPRVLNKLIKSLKLSDKLERKANKLYNLYRKVLGTNKTEK